MCLSRVLSQPFASLVGWVPFQQMFATKTPFEFMYILSTQLREPHDTTTTRNTTPFIYIICEYGTTCVCRAISTTRMLDDEKDAYTQHIMCGGCKTSRLKFISAQSVQVWGW